MLVEKNPFLRYISRKSKMKYFLFGFSIASLLFFSSCSYQDFKVFVPLGEGFLSIKKSHSHNSQIKTEREILWKWSNAQHGNVITFEIQDRPLLPNLNIAMKDKTNTPIDFEVVSKGALCAKLLDSTFQCSNFEPNENEIIEIMVCVEPCLVKSQMTFQLRIDTVGRFFAFDGP
jgi:hypothetical protein